MWDDAQDTDDGDVGPEDLDAAAGGIDSGGDGARPVTTDSPLIVTGGSP